VSYRIAVIGTGYMARTHCDTLVRRRDVQLATICSTDRSRSVGEELEARYGFERSTTEYSSVLADPTLDVVFVCSPDGCHAEQVSGALAAGKHVFCEKPLARTESQFAELREHVHASGKTLQVGMNCRFRDQYRRAHELARSGELGALRFLRGTYLVNAVEPVRSEAKPWWRVYPSEIFPFLHGAGIHCLDLLRWIGGDVSAVFGRATGFELGEELGADTFSVSVQFTSGAVGELLVSAAASRPNDFGLELWLSRGSIIGTTVYRRAGGDELAAEEIAVEKQTNDLELQFRNFTSAIESGGQPLNSFDEAHENFRVLEAVQRSISSGTEVPVRSAVTVEDGAGGN
jgi:predicted dehydrogenase